MKNWKWPWARRAFQNCGFPYNISATAGASDFKFGMLLELAYVARHKTPPREKIGVAMGYKSHQIFGVPL